MNLQSPQQKGLFVNVCLAKDEEIEKLKKQIATKRTAKEGLPNNKNYCWTHGFICSDGHTSTTCSRPAQGHKREATRENIMGGSERGKDRIT